MKSFTKLFGYAAVASLVSLVPAMPASAQADNAAEIIKDGGCTGFVPTAEGGFGPYLYTADGATAISTKAGTVVLICKFDIPEGQAPATATQASGFLCGTYFGTTYDTKMVATPGGKAVLTCHTNPSSDND